MSELSREEVVDRLARIIRNEEYPDFYQAPPPAWATRAAEAIIRWHQPMLRDTLLNAAVTAALDALAAKVGGMLIDAPSEREDLYNLGLHDALAEIDRLRPKEADHA